MNDNRMDGDANDDDRDMELPFKSAETCVAAAQVSIMHDMYADLAVPQQFSLSNDFVSENEFLLPSAFLSTIFQPPKR